MADQKVLSPDQQFAAANEKKVDQKKDRSSMVTLKSDITKWLEINSNVVLEFHNQIALLWSGNKDRNLATVESAVRGILADIGRLSESTPKLGTDQISKSTNPFAVSKPR